MLEAEITIDKLSRMAREAVLVNTRLGLRYRCVDCLCLTQGQDDNAKADWEGASVLMSKMYARAPSRLSELGSGLPMRDTRPAEPPRVGTLWGASPVGPARRAAEGVQDAGLVVGVCRCRR